MLLLGAVTGTLATTSLAVTVGATATAAFVTSPSAAWPPASTSASVEGTPAPPVRSIGGPLDRRTLGTRYVRRFVALVADHHVEFDQFTVSDASDSFFWIVFLRLLFGG